MNCIVSILFMSYMSHVKSDYSPNNYLVRNTLKLFKLRAGASVPILYRF